MTDYRDILAALKKKIVGQAATPPTSSDATRERIVAKTISSADIRIGLDFGTRWTKVAYRVDGADEVTHVYNGRDAQAPFYPTHVFIEPSGFRVFRHRKDAPPDAQALPYLKLLLREMKQPYIPLGEWLKARLSELSIKALSAFFLSHVIATTMAHIRDHEKLRLAGKRQRYWLNVSIPADHFGSAAADVFRDVAAVALKWAEAAEPPPQITNLAQLEAAYETSSATMPPEERERVEVFPEIIAAMAVFLARRDTPSGVHGFIDIGAGTLDGCVFQFERGLRGASDTVKILSSKVAELGSSILSYRTLREMQNGVSEFVEKHVISDPFNPGVGIQVRLPLEKIENDVKAFVGSLSVGAREKMPRELLDRKHSVQARSPEDRARQSDFTFHMAGGGAASPWYIRTLEAAIANTRADMHETMPFRCRVATGGSRSAATDQHYTRTLIAAGLTGNADDLKEINLKLPASIPDRSPLQRKTSDNNYADSKDWT